MNIYEGKSVFNGVAIGRISVYKKGDRQVERVKVEDTEAEITRYERAKAEAARQIQGLYDKALREAGEDSAAIFEVHQMMLDDDGYNDSIENMVRAQGIKRCGQRKRGSKRAVYYRGG